MMPVKFVPLFIVVTTAVAQTSHLICDNSGIDGSVSNVVYVLRAGSHYCYRYFNSRQTYREAEQVCRGDEAFLLRIDSQEENDYINSTFSSHEKFWMGLNDRAKEGVFEWTDGELLNESFQVWVDGSADAHNDDSFDCVIFTAEGWRIYDHFCENVELPFACRKLACNSTDGISCTVTVVPSSGLDPAVIAVVIIIPIVVILVVAAIIALILLWKFNNDAFSKYVCCCIYGSSKAQVNSLKQEIQRLQTELSQNKLNSSGRFPQLSRQTTQISLGQPQPVPFNRTLSSSRSLSSGNRIVPISGGSTVPAMQNRPSIARGNSLSMVKSPLPPVSEEKKPGE